MLTSVPFTANVLKSDAVAAESLSQHVLWGVTFHPIGLTQTISFNFVISQHMMMSVQTSGMKGGGFPS